MEMEGIRKTAGARVGAASVVLAAAVVIAWTIHSVHKKSDYITVTGQAEYVVMPDQAVVYFSINTKAATASAAQKLDAAATRSVTGALAGDGKIARKTETSSYNLHPEVDWTAAGPVDKGFSIYHQFKVTAGGINDVSRIIEVAVGAGANGVDSIDYEISAAAKRDASAEALKLATLAARDKARKVAVSMDLEVGRTLKIEEGGWWFQEPSAGAGIPVEKGAPEPGFIAPHALAAMASVNAVFEIVD